MSHEYTEAEEDQMEADTAAAVSAIEARASELYPQHAKLMASQAEHEAVSNFLSWLNAQDGFEVCEHRRDRRHGDEWHPVTDRQRAILVAGYFDIDVPVFEAEKDAMLDALRKANQETS